MVALQFPSLKPTESIIFLNQELRVVRILSFTKSSEHCPEALTLWNLHASVFCGLLNLRVHIKHVSHELALITIQRAVGSRKERIVFELVSVFQNLNGIVVMFLVPFVVVKIG